MPDPIKIPKVYLQLGDFPNPATPGRLILFCPSGEPESSPSYVIGSIITPTGVTADTAGPHVDPQLVLSDACDAYNAQRNAEEK